MVVPLVSVSRVVVCVVLVVIGSAVLKCDAQLLPQDEVDTLKRIATKLQNKYWNVTATACHEGTGLNLTTLPSGMISNVTCNCSFINGTVCHVTRIQPKGLNLTGIIPYEFGNLAYLTEMSALENRISGIPKEIGKINTLEELVLEDNLLEGTPEPNIGNLSRLRRLLLSANNFTGTISESFGNLKNLDDFRIDGSTLSGKILDFIGNWTKIKRLDMQGTYMVEPIPSSISLLTNLTELRISDWKGSSSNFPNLQGMNMKTLIRRNCLLTGSIPDYFGEWTGLTTLDLSINRLTGQVPDKMGAALDYTNEPKIQTSSHLIKYSLHKFAMDGTDEILKDWKYHRFSSSDEVHRDLSRENGRVKNFDFGVNCGEETTEMQLRVQKMKQASL